MLKKLLTTGVAAAALTVAAGTADAAKCTNDVWNKVMQRGKIHCRRQG